MNIIEKSRNGDVVLFSRDESPKIQCRVRDPHGKWQYKSTKTTDEAAALAVAEEWHSEMKLLNDRGYAFKPTSFSQVADQYVRNIEAEAEAGSRNAKDAVNYKAIVETYLKPYFGNKAIDAINNNDIKAYKAWRNTYWTRLNRSGFAGGSLV